MIKVLALGLLWVWQSYRVIELQVFVKVGLCCAVILLLHYIVILRKVM